MDTPPVAVRGAGRLFCDLAVADVLQPAFRTGQAQCVRQVADEVCASLECAPVRATLLLHPFNNPPLLSATIRVLDKMPP